MHFVTELYLHAIALEW